MPHSFNKIWIHAIWATKERNPFIQADMENLLYEFIKAEFQGMGCPARIINGMADHIHCLFLLSPQKSIAEVVKQIKGSSSHYINYNNLVKEKFCWQTGYAAYSVSESGLDRVFHYIRNQKQHHRQRSFQQEHDDYLKIYGLNQT